MLVKNIAQKQLDFYNLHDIDGFMSCYDEAVKVYNLIDNSLMLDGHQQFRQRYMGKFDNPKLHAKLVNRMEVGNKVIDHEHVSGISEKLVEVVAIYEIEASLIKRVWFLYK